MKNYIGLMSGTSLDGVDGALVTIAEGTNGLSMLAAAYEPFDKALRADLMALQAPGINELHREAQAANQLAHCYNACVKQLLSAAKLDAAAICAIGAHGQTIRHRPELGYTLQTLNPALLAELTKINVIADFRSRDVAAGGQGAPLVPAFHHAMFADSEECRVIANIGGISNITVLNNDTIAPIIGFDTGPGNILIDGWTMRHQNQPFDANGAWASSGTVNQALLIALRNEPFFAQKPPKSTGRDLFSMEWLEAKLASNPAVNIVDVQATLVALTATTLADSIANHAPSAPTVYVCGGGAFNGYLMQEIEQALRSRDHLAVVVPTTALGISPNHVEALAFAWLAEQYDRRQPGNLPLVTGAAGPRILGALYPAAHDQAGFD
jgi:anhydro-N-acetylmuramic acid kinase